MMEWTRNTPWRQGHLLPPEAVKLLPDAKDLPQDCQVIVASHDCDIAQLPESEPLLEVIVGRVITKLDGNFTNAKSARKLHVHFDGPTSLLVEFHAKDKRHIQKDQLCGIHPNVEYRLTKEDKNALEVWLASRYRRSAFPDEFEQRLKDSGLAKELTSAVRPTGKHIEKVLFDLSEKPSNDGMCYNLGIILLFGSEPDYATAQKAAERGKEEIESAIKNKTKGGNIGLDVDYVDAVSDQAMSYHQFSLLKPWRLDYISLASAPQQPIKSN